ncbi:MAG: V-type ATP synthase subunit A [Peptococcaceae bacterium]|jgi:V/A-type H+-transporting ATPase subunit A|nr:V-type ATP synthase subunit A [Peptococcaceae bacterium]
METTGEIYGINGPVLRVINCDDFHMSETVYAGPERLVGEVIGIKKGLSVVQVFEDTSGLAPGGEVRGTGKPFSVTLGPGILANIFDGIQRPLKMIERAVGPFIARGVHVSRLDQERLWETELLVKDGDPLLPGMAIAQTRETPVILHKAMVPPGLRGRAAQVKPSGRYTVADTLLTLIDDAGQAHELRLCQEWPIRVPRPVAAVKPVSRPLITGQRVIDTLFPIGKGGMAALPGGFGTGKTITQHQFAKWSDADIIIYIGCGERGNEMTQVLEDFSGLQDPRTGSLLMDRTALIANTSNMPVAAREASIYTGITIAEYYRDMGYHVAIMADSTSRWAEALRELSGRLEEMPAEEGFPAYLASRLASFYERAGEVETLDHSEGSVTIIGAVSPQGADFSEPVTQNTKRFVRCFWTLDRNLAYARHFPAIQWLTSYSEYLDNLAPWYRENVGEHFTDHRAEILKLLNQESELMEIVKLIGADVLPDPQKLILEIGRVIRLGFVQQNAYHPFDTYVPFDKQMKMMEVILRLYDRCRELVELGRPVSLLRSDGIFERVVAVKYNVPNDNIGLLDAYFQEIDAFYDRFAAAL